jgi:hypothetical protein
MMTSRLYSRLSMVVSRQIRGLSTTTSTVLPPNLHLADANIFEAPKPPVIPNIEFNFPILNPPTTISTLVFRQPGQKASEVPMNPKIFGVAIRRDIVHEVIRYHRNKIRQPHKTKRPEDLRGSGKKPWAQKGLGKTQVGNKRNSAWIGGFKVCCEWMFAMKSVLKLSRLMVLNFETTPST